MHLLERPHTRRPNDRGLAGAPQLIPRVTGLCGPCSQAVVIQWRGVFMGNYLAHRPSLCAGVIICEHDVRYV